MLRKILLTTMLAVSAFAMHSVELNINDTDIEANAKFDMGQFNPNVEPNTTFLGFRIVDADNTHGPKKGYKNDPYYEVNFLMKRPFSNSGLSVGMGFKFNYTTDFSSVPLGLETTYRIPAQAYVPMYLNGSVYYGPRVLSFGNADRYYEFRISYDIELIENARVTIGYRSMHTKYQDIRDDYVYNQAFYFGFKFFF